MFCTVCGEWGDLRHFIIVGYEVCCRPTFESIDEGDDLEPFWFGGTTNEAGEVYGG